MLFKGMYVRYIEGSHKSTLHAGTSVIGCQTLCVMFQLWGTAHFVVFILCDLSVLVEYIDLRKLMDWNYT